MQWVSIIITYLLFMGEREYTKNVNHSVTNLPEILVCSLAIACYLALMKIQLFNFINIAKLQMKLNAIPFRLYQINICQLVLTIVKIIVLIYSVIAAILDLNHHLNEYLYYNTVLYQFLSDLALISLNHTLLIVSKALSEAYPESSRVLGQVKAYLSLFLVLLNLFCMFSALITFIYEDDFYFIQINLSLLMVTSVCVDIVFVYYCVKLNSNTESLAQMSRKHKRILQYISYILIVGSLLKLFYIISRFLDASYILYMKKYDAGQRRNTSYDWAVFTFFQLLFADLVPQVAITSLFNPCNSKADSLKKSEKSYFTRNSSLE